MPQLWHDVTPKKGLKTRPYNIGMEKKGLKKYDYNIDMEKTLRNLLRDS